MANKCCCVLAVPSPHIYRLEERRGSQGGAPSRRNPTWAPPNSASPFHIHPEGEGRRREERRKGEAELLPFLSLFPSFLPPLFGLHGVHQPPRGWSVPFLAH